MLGRHTRMVPKGDHGVDGDGRCVALQPQVRRVRERRRPSEALRRMVKSGKNSEEILNGL